MGMHISHSKLYTHIHLYIRSVWVSFCTEYSEICTKHVTAFCALLNICENVKLIFKLDEAQNSLFEYSFATQTTKHIQTQREKEKFYGSGKKTQDRKKHHRAFHGSRDKYGANLVGRQKS